MVRNAPFFQVCRPGPGSVSKESDSGPPLSFSAGIPGSFSKSQLDILKNPAVTAFDRSLLVRARGGAVSGVPLPLRRQSGSGAEVVAVPISNISGMCMDVALTSCGCENHSVLTVSESLRSGQARQSGSSKKAGAAAVHAVAGGTGPRQSASALGVRRDFEGARNVFETAVEVSGAGVALCAATLSASFAGETDSERHVSELSPIAGRFSARGSGARVEPGEGLVSLAGESEGIN